MANAITTANVVWTRTITTAGSSGASDAVIYHYLAQDGNAWRDADPARDPGGAAGQALASQRARQQAQWEALREAAARRVEAEVLRDQADKRAEQLLLAHLSPEQQRDWRRAQYFELITKGGRYRLYKGWAGNVALIGENGAEISRYCIHPREVIPEADNLLAQKLMLELEEAEFLRIANRHPPRVPVPNMQGEINFAA